jgi:hypothetical protein
MTLRDEYHVPSEQREWYEDLLSTNVLLCQTNRNNYDGWYMVVIICQVYIYDLVRQVVDIMTTLLTQ